MAIRVTGAFMGLVPLPELGLADHVWQNKRAAIAQEVEALGPQFRQAMHDGWLKYIICCPARGGGNGPIHWAGEGGRGR